MLSTDIIKTLENYMQSMQNPLKFVIQAGKHNKRSELVEFLNEVASVSKMLSVEERDIPERLRSPISFLLEVDEKDTGVRFSGIPSGHEFNSLILAILQASGTPIKLDEKLKSHIKSVTDKQVFEVFVSLSCHNCPDVLQALVKEAADLSFNRITIDGDTSTNDSCMLIASGSSSTTTATP